MYPPQWCINRPPYPDGVYNAATFGLTRSGYSFVGWSTKADGSATVFDQNTALKAEQIYPNIKNGSATIKLYAIWQCNHTYANACDADCNVCGATREVDGHTYDSNYDATCNICGAIRDVPTAGDADGNGEVTVRDVALLQQYIAGWDATLDAAAADADGNGEVTVRDIALLQQYIAGWDVTLG